MRLGEYTNQVERDAEFEVAMKCLASQFDPGRDARLVSGIAVAPGGFFLPSGAVYSTPLPFLLEHNWQQVSLGRVTKVYTDAGNLRFEAEISNRGPVFDDLWTSIVLGDEKGISIGPDRNWAVRNSQGQATAWRLREISLSGRPDRGAGLTRCAERKPFVSLRGSSEVVWWGKGR